MSTNFMSVCQLCGRDPGSRRRRTRAISFDYYGTLADLPPQMRSEALDELRALVRVPVRPGAIWQSWSSRPPMTLAGPPIKLCGDATEFASFRVGWMFHGAAMLAPLGGDDEATNRFVEIQTRLHQEALAFADCASALTSLGTSHSIGVLSDADRGYLTSSLACNGLVVDAVVCSEDVSAYKPHVSMFDRICDELNCEPDELIHVGDSPIADVVGAAHAGIAAVWLNRDGSPWPEHLGPAPLTIRSLGELPRAILQLEGDLMVDDDQNQPNPPR
jgi:2-haloacid dehalogenase